MRLRELQTLFIKASASQSSYAIIGQGLVESVLNLRAEDRRELIEEAADIQRYRLKIEEAQNRLGATHENVERVRLVMKEIAPRVSQLERQAQRAGEHSRLSHELYQALQAYYEHQYHRANESLTVSRAAHDQAQAEFTQSKVALETCQRELADVEAQLEDQRKAAAASLAQRERLDGQIRNLEQRLAVAQERRAILQARQSELVDETRVIGVERDRASGVFAAEEENRRQLGGALSEARVLLETRQAELSGLEQEFRDAQTHAVDAVAKSKRLETAAAEMKARVRRLVDGQRDLEREASRLDVRRRSLVNQMAEQLRMVRGFRAQEEKLLADVSLTGARRQTLELEVQEIRAALTRVEADQNARRGKLEGFAARLAALSEAQEQMQGADLSDAVTVEGAVATVFEVIRVPRGLEEAIAAALAEQVEAFIFERRPEAIAAIQSLVAQRGPRTSVLPLDSLKQIYPLNIVREKGVLGVAASLIKYQSRYEKLVNTLLGRTIVVQDATVASRLIKRGLGTVVTLDGIVFHPTGYISGGQPRTSRPFILGYERDLEAIPKEMERTRRTLEITEREAEALRDRLQQAESSLATITRASEETLGKRLSLQDSSGQRQQKLAQLRGELRGLISSQSSIREQQRSLALEAERLEAEREVMLIQAKDEAETGGHLQKSNRLIDDRRQALTAAVNEATDAVAQLDGRNRSLVVQREGAEATLARLEAQASSKAVQARGIEMELSTLTSSIDADEKDRTQAKEHMESFLESAQPGREGTHHLEARQRDLHSQVLRSQGRLFESERQVLETEADVRRWQTEVQTLRLRIEEDGLTLTGDGDVITLPVPEQERVPSWLVADGPNEGSGGMRPIAGGAQVDPEVLGKEIEKLRAQIRGLGPVNIEAMADYSSLKERHDFLAGQVKDLEGAEQSLHRAIAELTGLMQKRFDTTFEQVAQGFEQYFHTFFGGGHAKLTLTDPKHTMTSGVEIEARPPGKRTQSLSQLSGGEKALTAVSLLFALLQVNPSPFCVLDEVDAMLDEANVGRFASALRELAQRTQFIVITHNRRTIEISDSIYGVSMAPDGASRVLSMRLADIASTN